MQLRLACAAGYVVKDGPAERAVGGGRAMFFQAETEISTQDGQTHQIVNTTHAIPCDDLLLQVLMSEALPAGHQHIFQTFIESFTFRNP